MADALTKKIQDLAKVADEEVNRAKNILKSQMLEKMMVTENRLQKIACKQLFMGEIKGMQQGLALLDGVTGDQVRGLAAKMIKTRPTLVVLGGEIHKVPSVDGFASRLQ